MTTEKRSKFVSLANKRVSNALKAISLIGNLSNRAMYDFNKEDLAKIFKVLTDEVDATQKRFQQVKKDGRSFQLD